MENEDLRKENESASNTKLYRGYIGPQSTSEEMLSRSDQTSIEELLSTWNDPHDTKYAEKLIWVTPDESFAKGVVAMRYIIKCAMTARESGGLIEDADFVPRLAEYNPSEEAALYEADGKVIHNANIEHGLEKKEYVIGSIPPEDITQRTISKESLQRLKAELESTRGVTDNIYRATRILTEVSGSDFMDELTESIRGKTLKEAIPLVVDFYKNKGVSSLQVEDLLSNGLFAFSAYFNKIADSCTYEVD